MTTGPLVGNRVRVNPKLVIGMPVPTAPHTEIVAALTGGAKVPGNQPWTACVSVTGTGTVEARLINGCVQFRGDRKINVTAAGSMTTVLKLPAGFPPPAVAQNVAVYAIATGSAFRIALARITVDGSIQLSAPNGAFDTASFDGVSFLVF